MKTSLRMLAMTALGLAMLATTGCSKLQARDQLNKGVQSYKNAKYEDAIERFRDEGQPYKVELIERHA